MRATVLLALAASASGGPVGRIGSVRPAKDDGERAEPRVKLSCGVKPRIKLRKSLEVLTPPPLPAPPLLRPFRHQRHLLALTCCRLPHSHRPHRHRPHRRPPHRRRPHRHRPHRHRPHRHRPHRPQALGTTLSFGAEYQVCEKEAHLETTWHDPRLGGQLSLRDLSTLEWRKTWLFPGIADAATRVEVRLRFLG